MKQQFVTWGAIAAGVVLLLLVSIGVRLVHRRPKKLNQEYYSKKWQEVQGKLRDKSLWPLAVIDADKLLDQALKQSKYKGKTMGERLVSAQHQLSRNDAVWFGHKLRNRLVHEETAQLKERDVKAALLGIRQALRDLGALV